MPPPLPTLKSPNNNPRPNFKLPILILVFGVTPHGTARCSWPIVAINAGPGGQPEDVFEDILEDVLERRVVTQMPK